VVNGNVRAQYVMSRTGHDAKVRIIIEMILSWIKK